MTIVTHRCVAVLALPLPVPLLSKTAHSVVTQMTGNAHLPSPNPPLPEVLVLLVNLDNLETATKTRTAGTIAARNQARTLVIAALHSLKAYVQQQADAQPEMAETIITSAGMAVKKLPKRVKVDFVAKPGLVTGTVKLVAKAAAMRACYEWAWSADGGKTWTQVATTLQSKTTIIGLPVATTCSFRYRAVTKAGEGDWSQVVTLLVK